MNKIISALFSLCVIAGCGSKKQKPAPASETAVAPTVSKTFFPVTAFLKGQLAELDSMPVTPLLISFEKGKTDSAWLKDKAVIKNFVEPFFAQLIDTANLSGLFIVTKFNDQTINAITFTHDPAAPLPDSVKLKHWDIYISPETGKVTKVYLLREIEEKKVVYTQQLIWQTGKWAKITTLLDGPGGTSEVLKEEKLVWGFSE